MKTVERSIKTRISKFAVFLYLFLPLLQGCGKTSGSSLTDTLKQLPGTPSLSALPSASLSKNPQIDPSLEYSFNPTAGVCTSSSGDIGANLGLLANCGVAESITATNLTGASLQGLTVQSGTIADVNFTNANLTSANLQGTQITNTNFTGATVTGIEMQNSTVATSVISDPVVYQEIIENGASLLNGNTVPPVVAQVDQLTSNPNQYVASVAGLSSIPDAAQVLISEIQAIQDQKVRNMDSLRTQRQIYVEVKNQRDNKGKELNSVTATYSSSNSELNKLKAKDLDLIQQYRSAVTKYSAASQQQEKDQLIRDLTDLKRQRGVVAEKLKRLKSNQVAARPAASNLVREVASLVDQAQAENSNLATMKAANKNYATQLSSKIATLNAHLVTLAAAAPASGASTPSSGTSSDTGSSGTISAGPNSGPSGSGSANGNSGNPNCRGNGNSNCQGNNNSHHGNNDDD